MGGIQFLTDEKGKKTAAVIDLKVHKALWEDLQDVLVSRSRRLEKGVPLDKVRVGLISSNPGARGSFEFSDAPNLKTGSGASARTGRCLQFKLQA